ncbi:MAG: Fic family protein [Pseudohongiellaceae bacterium]
MPKRVTAASRLGKYVVTASAGERVSAYVPPRLPPTPPLDINPLLILLEQANRSLGRLDSVASILPDTHLFLYMYIRKEALLSSQIEGTQSSLSDLLLFESDVKPGVPLEDVQEVSNYVAAMSHGLQQLHALPISNRLIKEIHGILMAKGRGSSKGPGQFRRSQNWIGGTRPGNAMYVPPPANVVTECMSDLEKFIHEENSRLPLLVKAALVHVQFETIHPFLDGNGRLGRLLITFMLCAAQALKEPTLYLSLYFKRHRQQYYHLLQAVREKGDWESWLEFFLTGVKETSDQAANTANRIIALIEADRNKLDELGRPAASALRVFHYLQTHPIISVAVAERALQLSAPTIRKAIHHLEAEEILAEVSGRQRDKRYVYVKYLDILSEGTEPL